MVLDVFTFVVFGILIAALSFAVVKLGGLPGKIAKDRGHPQADAIGVCGWVGILVPVAWPVALVWAFTRPGAAPAGEGRAAR